MPQTHGTTSRAGAVFSCFNPGSTAGSRDEFNTLRRRHDAEPGARRHPEMWIDHLLTDHWSAPN